MTSAPAPDRRPGPAAPGPAAPGPAAPGPAAPGPAAHRPVAHTAWRIGRGNLVLLAWFWVVVTPFFVGLTLVLARVEGGALDAAVILYSRQGAIWFPFAQAIILVATFLRVHVAAGMTRRTFARATLVVGVGTGLAYAVVLAALAAVERALHHAVGWDWRVADAVLADESSPAGLLLTELAVACVAANVCGLLVGAAYQRAGGWWGTLTLPVTAGPVLLVIALLGSVPTARGSWADAALPLVGALLVTGLAAAGYTAVTSRTPVRSAVP